MAVASSAVASVCCVPVVGPSQSSPVDGCPTKIRLMQSENLAAAQIFAPLVHRASTYSEDRTADGALAMKDVKMRILGTTENKLGGPGGGASVLERPGLDQAYPDTAPRTEEGGERGKASQKARTRGGDRYRVLLLDHERHTEDQVAKVLPRVVPTVTPDDARKCFFESREFGFGLVTVTVREHAEFYKQMMTRYGLRSTIERDGTVA